MKLPVRRASATDFIFSVPRPERAPARVRMRSGWTPTYRSSLSAEPATGSRLLRTRSDGSPFTVATARGVTTTWRTVAGVVRRRRTCPHRVLATVAEPLPTTDSVQADGLAGNRPAAARQAQQFTVGARAPFIPDRHIRRLNVHAQRTTAAGVCTTRAPRRSASATAPTTHTLRSRSRLRRRSVARSVPLVLQAFRRPTARRLFVRRRLTAHRLIRIGTSPPPTPPFVAFAGAIFRRVARHAARVNRSRRVQRRMTLHRARSPCGQPLVGASRLAVPAAIRSGFSRSSSTARATADRRHDPRKLTTATARCDASKSAATPSSAAYN